MAHKFTRWLETGIPGYIAGECSCGLLTTWRAEPPPEKPLCPLLVTDVLDSVTQPRATPDDVTEPPPEKQVVALTRDMTAEEKQDVADIRIRNGEDRATVYLDVFGIGVVPKGTYIPPDPASIRGNGRARVPLSDLVGHGSVSTSLSD